jgi:hypothetical protein
MQTTKQAVSWFSATCGVGTPREHRHWEVCFTTLCNDLHDLLTKAVAACDCFDSADDGPSLVKDLRERLDRAWEAHRFDCYVEAVMNRLAYSGYDVVTFRNRHLEQWRKIVTTSVDEQIERNLTLRIEADLLAEFAGALPITAEELAQLISFPSPEALVAALSIIKGQAAASRVPVLQLLRNVKVDVVEPTAS